MSLLESVIEGAPAIPKDGWDIGLLAHLGVLLSADGFKLRLDLDNLNALFDILESGIEGEIKDFDGKIVEAEPAEHGVIFKRPGDRRFPTGILLGLPELKELGVELEELEDEKPVEEGIKRAYRKSGKKIKRGFRVTSGFRKGRVVSSPKAAFKPRAKASTRMKLKIASRRKKVIRIMKAKRTRKKPLSKRLVNMNKRAK